MFIYKIMKEYLLEDEVSYDFYNARVIKLPVLKVDSISNKAELVGSFFPYTINVVYEQLLEYIQPLLDKGSLHLGFKVEFYNTLGAFIVAKLLQYLEDYYKKSNEISVTWFYIKDDEDMKEAGYEFKELVNLPFTIKPYD